MEGLEAAVRPVLRLPIEKVRPGESARLGELIPAHLEAVAGVVDAWAPLVITSAGRIVDGHYRYHAARRLGLGHVRCVVFDGDEGAAFLESVRLNSRHGLPLTLRERKYAASRILALCPAWSDRRIADLCGLAHETVGRLRSLHRWQSGEHRQVDKRVGRGGRSHTVNPAAVRERIVAAIQAHPEASLRKIALIAGSNHETVRSVRHQLAARARPQLSPVPTGATTGGPALSPLADAAFTSTDRGASFARWFELTTITNEWADQVESVPLSRIYEIADEARRRASAWTQFAVALTMRVGGRSGWPGG
jgi:hypothetical protein